MRVRELATVGVFVLGLAQIPSLGCASYSMPPDEWRWSATDESAGSSPELEQRFRGDSVACADQAEGKVTPGRREIQDSRANSDRPDLEEHQAFGNFEDEFDRCMAMKGWNALGRPATPDADRRSVGPTAMPAPSGGHP